MSTSTDSNSTGGDRLAVLAPVMARYMETLSAICDTLVASLDAEEITRIKNNLSKLPPIPPCIEDSPGAVLRVPNDADITNACRMKASDLDIPRVVANVIADPSRILPDKALEIKILLTLLGSRIGMLALCGFAKPFAKLCRSDREVALGNLRDSMVPHKRKAFLALKAVICSQTFATNSVMLSVAGYRTLPAKGVLPLPKHSEEFIFPMLNSSISCDVEFSFDVVVVGSGCGGSVVAAELAGAGYKVLVLEKGEYLERKRMPDSEAEALAQMYERGGLMATESGSLAVLAGSTFGGGSSVNWACCLPTPEPVRREWAERFGLQKFAPSSQEFDSALDFVQKRIGVQQAVTHTRANELLIKGCKALNYDIQSTSGFRTKSGPRTAAFF